MPKVVGWDFFRQQKVKKKKNKEGQENPYRTTLGIESNLVGFSFVVEGEEEKSKKGGQKSHVELLSALRIVQWDFSYAIKAKEEE